MIPSLVAQASKSYSCTDPVIAIEPEYLAATSARKTCGIKVPRGTKAKQVVLKYVLDNVPEVVVEYTKHGNPTPGSYDRADSYIIAKAGWINLNS